MTQWRQRNGQANTFTRQLPLTGVCWKLSLYLGCENKTPHETNSVTLPFLTNSLFVRPWTLVASDDSFPFGAFLGAYCSGVPNSLLEGRIFWSKNDPHLRVWEAVPSRSPTAPFFAPGGERGLVGWYAYGTVCSIIGWVKHPDLILYISTVYAVNRNWYVYYIVVYIDK